MLLSLNEILTEDDQIDSRLSAVIDGGFTCVDNCYLFTNFYKNNGHIKIEDFPDKTGFECFINSFHIDDFIEQRYLTQAIFFTNLLFKEWEKLSTGMHIEVIIGETDNGVNVRFHVIRENEVWIDDHDIDKFDQGLLVCRSM